MVNKYKLINPLIKGGFESKIEAKNSLEAAKTLYKSLSEHFNNNVPKFHFTIQKGGGKRNENFYHYEVLETKKDEEVKYSIKPYEIKDEGAVKQYVENFNKFKGRFNGGSDRMKVSAGKKSSRKKSSHKKSSRKKSSHHYDESSEDSYDFYREAKSYVPVTSQPLYYMYYDPLVYRLDSVYIPTFYQYAQPYLEIASYAYQVPGYTVTY